MMPFVIGPSASWRLQKLTDWHYCQMQDRWCFCPKGRITALPITLCSVTLTFIILLNCEKKLVCYWYLVVKVQTRAKFCNIHPTCFYECEWASLLLALSLTLNHFTVAHNLFDYLQRISTKCVIKIALRYFLLHSISFSNWNRPEPSSGH